MLPELPASDTNESTAPPLNVTQLTTVRAAAEVLICSGFPTQLAIVAALTALGVTPGTETNLNPAFVFLLSGVDTVLLLGLVLFFLRRSNDDVRRVFLGHSPPIAELLVGVSLVPVVFMSVVLVQVVLRLVAPSLHNVEVSPFAPFLQSPALLVGFVVLVLVAGGVREEVQRAFLLHRFEQRLGGGRLGLLLTSMTFGLGHTVQGWDAAIITAVLGALWGAMYLARRSVVATVTNHALFNLAQIVLGYAMLMGPARSLA